MVVSRCLCLFILLTWIVICTLTSRHVSTYVLRDHTCKCEVSLQAHTFIIIKLIPCVASFSSQKQEGEITFSRPFVRLNGAPFASWTRRYKLFHSRLSRGRESAICLLRWLPVGILRPVEISSDWILLASPFGLEGSVSSGRSWLKCAVA